MDRDDVVCREEGEGNERIYRPCVARVDVIVGVILSYIVTGNHDANLLVKQVPNSSKST